jgi:hypothetical protein
LWWKLVPPTRQHVKAIELVQEDFRPAFFVDQSFPLGSPYLPLVGVLMESSEEFFDSGPKIERVEAIRFALAESWCARKVRASRTDLDVLPLPFFY